jgi:nicotinamidase-related amidase
VQSHDRTLLTNNVVGLARASRAFDVPTVLTTMAARDFGGPLLPELKGIYPELKANDRTMINAWEDQDVVEAIRSTRRKKLIIAGLWSELSLALPALSAVEEGFSVYVVADTGGATNIEAHHVAMQQLVQSGARIRTWQQIMFAWQRDWACLNTVGAVREIIHCHGGAFPPSVILDTALCGVEPSRPMASTSRGIRPVGMSK